MWSVIGAGSTGAAIAHDLALRGVRVTHVERFGPAAGTTGHNQAQLHSGARYAVNDPESARECIEENRILRKIMPGALELNDGLFIALNEEHLSYRETFLEGCANCNIPTEEISTDNALKLEPRLQPRPASRDPHPGRSVRSLSFHIDVHRHGAEEWRKVSAFP